MKKIIHILMLSILFSFNISCAMEEREVPVYYLFCAGMVTGLFGVVFYKMLKHYWLSVSEDTTKQNSPPVPKNVAKQNDDNETRGQSIPDKILNSMQLKKEMEQFQLGITDLHKACENNDAEKVESLLQSKKLKINAQCKKKNLCDRFEDDKTSLHIACENENETIVDLLLLQDDIDLTIQDFEGNTVFHSACMKGNLKIVKKLLSCGKKFDINMQNTKGQTALTLAYHNKSFDVFAYLLELDNIDPMETLCVACYRNDSEMFQRLLKHKRIEFQDNRALYVACRMGHVDMVRSLLECNKNDCMKINEFATGKAEWYRKKKWCTPFNCYNPLLIACKTLVPPKDVSGKKTIKTGSIREKFIEIIKLLLTHEFVDTKKRAGITPWHDDKKNQTVLHFAASDSQLLRLLLPKDASLINVEHDGERPLQIAIKKGTIDCVRLLIQYGADIFAEDYRGYNALALACESVSQDSSNVSRVDIAKWLLEIYYFRSKKHTKKEVDFLSECLSQCLYLLICKKGKTNKDICHQLLLYGADPHHVIRRKIERTNRFYPERRKYFFSSPALKAAKYDVSILNILLSKHPIPSMQKNYRGHTIIFRAFMFNQVKCLEQVHYFRDLDEQQKEKEIRSELYNLVGSNPTDIIKIWENAPVEKRKEIGNNAVQRLYSFVTICNEYSKIETSTSFRTEYARSKKIYSLYCYPDGYQKTFWHEMGLVNGKHYVTVKNDYNELIVHAFIQHVTPQTDEQKAEKAIALGYKNNPTEYYLSKRKDKKNIKDYFLSQV